MTESVIAEYADRIVERRERTVHVVEERRSSLTAWHGGRLLTELCTFTSAAAAVRQARADMTRFDIDAGSSLTLRVDERVKVRWKVVRDTDGGRYVTYQDRDARPSQEAGGRHVWDSVAGMIEAPTRDVPFRVSAWVGLPDAERPLSTLKACFADVETEILDDRLLLGGMGLGRPRLENVSMIETLPPDRIRDRDGSRAFLRVDMDGLCPVNVPFGASESDVGLFLERCTLGCVLDFGPLDVLLPHGKRPIFWTGAPTAEFAWNPPPPALEAPRG